VIAPFDRVTHDLESVIRQVNDKFGTSFADGPVLHERKKPLGWHAMPTELRDQIKQELDEGFSATHSKSAKLRSLLSKANDLHDEIIAVHDRHC